MANPTNRPTIRAGEYVYIMEGETVVVSSGYSSDNLYRCDSAGVAARDIYTSNVNEIREALNFIKDRGTVFQDRYEEASSTSRGPEAPRIVEDLQLNTVSITHAGNPQQEIDGVQPVQDPIDERTMLPVSRLGDTYSQAVSVWQTDPQGNIERNYENPSPTTHNMNAYPGRDFEILPTEHGDRPLGAVLESTDLNSGVNTTRLNNTADAIDPELVKTMKRQGRFPRIDRTQLEVLKDLQDGTIKHYGQYLPCFGCEDSLGALFPGGYSDSDKCVTCFRRTGRECHRDVYMPRGMKAELYKQFAEEIVPVIKKQAIFEAKKRISEAEEKENKSKRTMVRIAKRRA